VLVGVTDKIIEGGDGTGHVGGGSRPVKGQGRLQPFLTGTASDLG